MMLSTPHFYMGAEEYIKAIDGINPVKEEHETHIDLEPVSRLANKHNNNEIM